MKNERSLSPAEIQARRTARVLQLSAQGYSQAQIARQIGCSISMVGRDIERVKKRTTAADAAEWRQVQLLRLERSLEALESVLAARHIVVSNGHVVSQYVLDEDGKPIWDPVYGPDGEQLTDSDGALRVEQRKIPLEDHGVVLDTIAEMRKIEDSIMKLLGTQRVVKQEVEVQHVSYSIEGDGVDMSKILGHNLDPKK
jgi:DNA-binding CsgD family transcriptional regulator